MTERLSAKVVVGAETAGARRELDRLKQSFGDLRTLLLGALGVESARRLGEVVDGYAQMSARLKLVTRDQTEFNTAQKELFGIAQRNQTGLQETVTLYTRLAPAVRQLGGNQSQVLKITEAVALSLRVSGASAAESASAILQFSQAMGAGALRGEEFNAVAEASPRLMQALSDGLGKSRGELKKLAEEGKLTADVVGNALIGQLGALRREADTLPQTIGGAFQRLRNEFTKFVGESQNVGAGARALISVVNLLAANLDKVLTVIAAVAAGFAAWKLGAIVVAIGGFVASAGGLAASLAGVAAVLAGPAGLVALVAALAGALLLLKDRSDDSAKGSEAALRAQMDALRKRIAQERAAAGGALPNSANLAAKSAAEERLAQLERELALIEAQAEARREANRAQQLASTGTPLKGNGLVAVNKEFEKELARLREEVEKTRELTQLEQTRLDIMRRKFGALSPAQKQALLDAAAEIDAEKAFKNAVEDSEAATKRANAEQQRLNAERRTWIDQVTGRAGATRIVKDLATLDEEFFAGRLSVQEYENGLRKAAGITDELKKKTEDASNVAGQLGFSFSSALEDAIVQLKPLRDVFAGLGQDLSRIFTREFLSKPMAEEFTAFFKELFKGIFQAQQAGELGRSAAQWVRGLFGYHGGGVVGSGTDGFRTSRVSPLAFVGAPRYHSGGIAGMGSLGLRSNEVPAILERGERVLTAQQQQAMALGGGVKVDINVNGAGGEASALQRAGTDLAQVVRPVVEQWAAEQRRPGGVLWSPV